MPRGDKNQSLDITGGMFLPETVEEARKASDEKAKVGRFRTVNQKIFDNLLRADHLLFRLETKNVTRLFRLFRRVQQDIARDLDRRAQTNGKSLSDWSRRQLLSANGQMAAFVRQVFEDGEPIVRDSLLEMAQASELAVLEAVERAIPVDEDLGPLMPYDTARVPFNTLVEVVEQPFRGATWVDRWRTAEADLVLATERSLGESFTLGEGVRKASARLRRKYEFLGTQRSEMIIRTESIRVLQNVRMDNFERNSDVMRGIQYVATLDGRTCFPAGTMVETPSGQVPIEDLRAGSVVLTHTGNYRRVTGKLSREYRGSVRTLEAGELHMSSTADHPVLTGLGWMEARDVQVGDVVLQRVEEVGSGESSRAVRHDDVDGNEPELPQACIPSGLLGGVAVPVGSIDLESDGEVHQKEVHKQGPDLVLGYVGETDRIEQSDGLAFRSGGSSVPAIASVRAEDSILAWDSPKPSAAVAAVLHDRRAATLFGAVSTEPISIARECSSAALTVNPDSPGKLTGLRAVVVPAGIAPWDVERLPAGDTEFLHLGIDGTEVTRTGAEFRVLLGSEEGFAARGTGNDRSSATMGLRRKRFPPPVFGDALSRAALPVELAPEVLTALETGLFHEVMITRITDDRRALMVYNIEVEGDRSYVADGFAVHNCPRCALLDGMKWFFGGEPPASRFPLIPQHPNCRCTSTPVTKSAEELGWNKEQIEMFPLLQQLDGAEPGAVDYETWLGDQPVSVQNNVLGPTRARLFRKDELPLAGMVDAEIGGGGPVQTRLLRLDELPDEIQVMMDA